MKLLLLLGISLCLGLAFDDWDLDYYTQLFVDKIKRNPSSVECFDLAQSNRFATPFRDNSQVYVILNFNI